MICMYDINYTQRALDDLKWFRKNEQVTIIGGINKNLKYEPDRESRNCKRMGVNAYAEWELRINNFRVLYNIDQEVLIIEIQRIGEKQGNQFFFRGKGENV